MIPKSRRLFGKDQCAKSTRIASVVGSTLSKNALMAVRLDLEREILDRVATLANSRKCWGGTLIWRQAPRHRSNTSLQLVAPLLVGGVAQSGFQARFNARADLPEGDVDAQLELWCPEIEGFLHFERLEWRPIRPHTNPQNAPAGLRGRCLADRHYPFSLNRRLGIQALLQTVTLIGRPLPNDLGTYQKFTEFLGTVWMIDTSSLPTPPWQGTLL
jgi:hypothetical protein